MSQLVKTKRQANFKDFKRFGWSLEGARRTKKRCIQLVRVSVGLFWPIYTRTRQINYYINLLLLCTYILKCAKTLSNTFFCFFFVQFFKYDLFLLNVDTSLHPVGLCGLNNEHLYV
jgi:hypothetical protein